MKKFSIKKELIKQSNINFKYRAKLISRITNDKNIKKCENVKFIMQKSLNFIFFNRGRQSPNWGHRGHRGRRGRPGPSGPSGPSGAVGAIGAVRGRRGHTAPTGAIRGRGGHSGADGPN